MKMEYRFATDSDLDLLAEWNHQLIRDEGHRNPMTVPELRERMRGWLGGEYKAVIFGPEADPVAYALYRETATEVYLRQLFVRRDRRREGIGRAAMEVLRSQVWPRRKRLTVEVLTANLRAVAFWRSIGYKDYCLTLEIMPEKDGEQPVAADVLPRAAER
jgi:GNAT superfamily N-acetyltransferase